MMGLRLMKDNLLFLLESLYLYLFVIIKPLLRVLLYKGHVGTFVRGLDHLVNFRERCSQLWKKEDPRIVKTNPIVKRV